MGKKSAEKANVSIDAQSRAAQSQVGLAERQADIGEQIWGQTAPAREFATNTYMGLAKGNVPGIEKYAAPSINAATQQFYLARKSIESMPPGPARDAAMRDVAMQEAAQKTSIYSGGAADALSRVASMGWGGAGMTTGALGAAQTGMGGAAGTYGNIAQNYGQMASDKGGMAASGVGAAGSVIGALA